jgi:hypothetical protein
MGSEVQGYFSLALAAAEFQTFEPMNAEPLNGYYGWLIISPKLTKLICVL